MIEKYPAIPEIAKAVPNNIDANITYIPYLDLLALKFCNTCDADRATLYIRTILILPL
jgi:hypothetical protein